MTRLLLCTIDMWCITGYAGVRTHARTHPSAQSDVYWYSCKPGRWIYRGHLFRNTRRGRRTGWTYYCYGRGEVQVDIQLTWLSAHKHYQRCDPEFEGVLWWHQLVSCKCMRSAVKHYKAVEISSEPNEHSNFFVFQNSNFEDKQVIVTTFNDRPDAGETGFNRYPNNICVWQCRRYRKFARPAVYWSDTAIFFA